MHLILLNVVRSQFFIWKGTSACDKSPPPDVDYDDWEPQPYVLADRQWQEIGQELLASRKKIPAALGRAPQNPSTQKLRVRNPFCSRHFVTLVRQRSDESECTLCQSAPPRCVGLSVVQRSLVSVVCFFFCPLPIGCFFSRCFFSWTGGTRPAVWLKLSPRGLAHALAGGLAQAFAALSGSCSRRRSGSSFRRAVWLMLSPAVLLKLSPRPMLSPAVLLKLSPHAFCLCLSPVASSPRSRASSSSAFPVLLGL
jgi:hypothetical protein